MAGHKESHRLPCRVEFYAGSRADEVPRLIRLTGRDLRVEKTLARRRIFDIAAGETTEEFTVVVEGRTAKLRRTISGRWSLLFPRP